MRECELGWCSPGAVIEINGLNAVVIGADLSQDHWMILQRSSGHRASFPYDTPVRVEIEPVHSGIIALQMLEATRQRGESWPPAEPVRTSLPTARDYLPEPGYKPRRKVRPLEDLL